MKTRMVMSRINDVKLAFDTISTIKRHHKEFSEWREARKKEFKISIKENDEMFFDIQSWLLTLPSTKDIYEWSMNSDHGRNIRYAYNGEDYHYVTWNKIKIGFKMESAKTNDDDGEKTSFFLKSLVLVMENRGALEVVQDHIKEIANNKKKLISPPKIHIFGRWGWDRSEAPLRDLKSVVLREDIKETLSNDISRFLNEEDDYLKKGIPYHRGILLHGPPGTGKTSLVKGLAKEHGLDIYYISLNDLKSDGEFLDKIHEVSPKSIVLMEDVDSSQAAKGDDVTNGVTTSGLLNVLDGLFTPYGMIAILTTNHPDKLAESVLRPGRVDLNVEIGYCDNYQVNGLYRSFYGIESDFDIKDIQIASSEVTEIFKQNLYDPEKAKKDFLDYLTLKESDAELNGIKI